MNYLAKFLPGLSDLCEPLRQLTTKDAVWCWLESHEKALTQIKKAVTEAPVLKFFDTSATCSLQTDASETGLGAVLMQNGQPIAYASRALTNRHITSYAQIEMELLAVVWGIEKFHHYTTHMEDQ